MGKMKNILRLPLTPLSPGAQGVVEQAMRQAGALNLTVSQSDQGMQCKAKSGEKAEFT
jgi:hypothetical protein